jgi:hypothetical protein
MTHHKQTKELTTWFLKRVVWSNFHCAAPDAIEPTVFASLPRDLYDDATCTTRRRSFTSFEAKLENPSLTCFVMKQATGCQRVSSHRLHPLIDFEA